MASAKEDDEDDLCSTENFTPNRACEDLAGVCHIVHMGIPQLEGSNDVASSCRDSSQTLRSATAVSTDLSPAPFG